MRNASAADADIFYRRSKTGGDGWEPEVRLTTAAGQSISPSLAVAGSAIYVVWADNRTGDFEIYIKSSSDGGNTWGGDVRLTNTAGESLGPSVIVGGTQLHVVWNDTRDGNLEIYYKRGLAVGSGWESDVRLTNSPASSSKPSIAFSSGYAHVAWTEDIDIAYRRSADGGTTWDPIQQISHQPGGTLRRADWPSIAAVGQNVHVVWMDNRNGSCIYCFALYHTASTSGGSTWGSEQAIATDESSTGYPMLLAEGSMVRVVWASRGDVSGTAIYYMRSRDGGATWDARATIHAVDQYLDRPSLATSGGRIHVIWTLDPYEPNPFVHYTHFQEGPDLDVADAGWDMVGGELRMRHTSGSALWIGVFTLANTNAGYNPDPDGPSEVATLQNVTSRPGSVPRPEAQVQADFTHCLTASGIGGSLPGVWATQSLRYVDLLSTARRVPAVVVLPRTLAQGVRAKGEVVACVPLLAASGIYTQRLMVSAQGDGQTSSDGLRVRLRKGPYPFLF
jgi:hypothetical protein